MSNPNTDYNTINYIRNKFKDYYSKHYAENIKDIDTREFGIGDYGKKISKRHLFFSDLNSFNSYLRKQTPFFVSYSAGYFKYPDRRPMDKKDWYGADIVYEFDSDDFSLPCHDRHNVWVCKNPECKDYGYGNPNFCEKCKAQVEIIEWTCDECLGKAKQETIRLINFLETDFKLDPSTFIISFSGSKGYHVRITDKSIIPLSKSSRLQLMNYILGNDLNLNKLGFKNERKKWSCPSPSIAKGWSKKIMNYLINIISNSSEKELIDRLGISSKKAQLILVNKENILNKMHHNILWNEFTASDKFWKNLINKAIEDIRLLIDPSSSSDIYKIMRTPDTIHGGTGFLSTSIKSIEDLKEFDAFSDPVVLKSEVIKKVKILKPTPKFRLIKEYFGPYNIDEIVDLPEHVAIFLILKGVSKFE